MGDKLQKIAEFELDQVTYDLAKNGRFRLVHSAGKDAYDRPISRAVELDKWMTVERVQALLDALGETTMRLQTQRDARLAGRKLSDEPLNQ